MLDERKIKAAELKAQGMYNTEIAKKVGVSRQAIQEWLKDEEFKAELDRWLQEFRNCTKYIFACNAPKAARKLVNQIDSSSNKTSLDASQYTCDRVLGKPTTKVEQSDDFSNDNITEDDILSVIDSVDHTSNE